MAIAICLIIAPALQVMASISGFEALRINQKNGEGIILPLAAVAVNSLTWLLVGLFALVLGGLLVIFLLLEGFIFIFDLLAGMLNL